NKHRLCVFPNIDGRISGGTTKQVAAIQSPAIEDAVHLALQSLEGIPHRTAERLPTGQRHIVSSSAGNEIEHVVGRAWAADISGESKARASISVPLSAICKSLRLKNLRYYAEEFLDRNHYTPLSQ